MALPPTDADDGGGADAAAAADAQRLDLTRRARAIGAVLWASFLAAGIGTMVFFAYVAPESLVGDFPADDRVDRIGVYTLGFFGLWCLSALASALALYVHGQLGQANSPRRRSGEGP